MGFNIWTTHLMLASQLESGFRENGTIFLGGRQSVFLSEYEISELYRSYKSNLDPISELSQAGTDTETLRTQGGLTDTAFCKLLFNLQVKSFDVSKYENAETILDLNKPFSQHKNWDSLRSSAEVVFDGGCLDNVWNPAMALMNFASLLSPQGRIFNWVCGSNWPGAYAMVSCEWLLSFYAVNKFQDIRVYWFHPLEDKSIWPNKSALVYRYNPNFTRDPNYDRFAAATSGPSHPGFVLATAKAPSVVLSPEDWVIPIQSHYIYENLQDWRENYTHSEDLPILMNFDNLEQYEHARPINSDHYKLIGEISGVV